MLNTILPNVSFLNKDAVVSVNGAVVAVVVVVVVVVHQVLFISCLLNRNLSSEKL